MTQAAWSSLQAAAASLPAETPSAAPTRSASSSSNSSAGGGGGGGGSSSGTPAEALLACTSPFWPLTSPFRNPYSSYAHFKQSCGLLQDLPGLILELHTPKGGRPPRKDKQWQAQQAQQQQKAVAMGVKSVQSPEWPFLTLVGQQGSTNQPGSSTSSSGSSAASSQPSEPATRWGLHVTTSQLRQEVWRWSLSAKDCWKDFR